MYNTRMLLKSVLYRTCWIRFQSESLIQRWPSWPTHRQQRALSPRASVDEPQLCASGYQQALYTNDILIELVIIIHKLSLIKIYALLLLFVFMVSE